MIDLIPQVSPVDPQRESGRGGADRLEQSPLAFVDLSNELLFV
jgi:hypothetical protein